MFHTVVYRTPAFSKCARSFSESSIFVKNVLNHAVNCQWVQNCNLLLCFCIGWMDERWYWVTIIKLNSSVQYRFFSDEFLNSYQFSFPLLLGVGLLATEGVEIESFSAPVNRSGDLWYCVGVSSLLRDLSALKTLVKEAAQVTL